MVCRWHWEQVVNTHWILEPLWAGTLQRELGADWVAIWGHQPWNLPGLSEWDRWSWGDIKLCFMNDQTAGSVTTLSRLLLAEQGPILAPGDGEEGIFLYFWVVQGEQKGQKGTEWWRTWDFGAVGKGCVVTAASWLLRKINVIIWGRPVSSFNC